MASNPEERPPACAMNSGLFYQQPNPSLQPTCYGWLRQPSQAAELKR